MSEDIWLMDTQGQYMVTGIEYTHIEDLDIIKLVT